MDVIFMRFPYESAYGGEEYHTLSIAKYIQQQGGTVGFFGSCSVLQNFFTAANLHTCKMPAIKAPVTPMRLCIFLFLFPFLFVASGMLALYLVWFVQPKSVYMLSITEKLLCTPWLLFGRCSIIWVEHQYLGRWWQKSPLRYLYVALSKFVQVIPISQANTEVLTTFGVNQSSLSPIVHGIDLANFVPVSQCPKKYLIGFSGRLEKDKGVQVLLESVATLRSEIPKHSVVIHGEGSYKKHLVSLIQERKLEEYVSILPPLQKNDYVHFLQHATLYVLPALSLRETFSLTAAEAMACGSIVLTTTMAGISTHVRSIHSNLVVEPGNSVQLANAIQFAQQHTAEFAEQSAILAKKTFDKQRMLQEYHSLLFPLV